MILQVMEYYFSCRYKQSQFYSVHYDYFTNIVRFLSLSPPSWFFLLRIKGALPVPECMQTHIKKGGQRVATMLMYLNDDVEGGETYFPMVSIICEFEFSCFVITDFF